MKGLIHSTTRVSVISSVDWIVKRAKDGYQGVQVYVDCYITDLEYAVLEKDLTVFKRLLSGLTSAHQRLVLRSIPLKAKCSSSKPSSTTNRPDGSCLRYEVYRLHYPIKWTIRRC